MPKLSQHEFEFMVNAALDTKDEKMFQDLMKRQSEETFLDFVPEPIKKEVLSFDAKERLRLIKDLEVIAKAYKTRTGRTALQDLINDVDEAITSADERILDHDIKQSGVQPLTQANFAPLDFPPTVHYQYMTVTYEQAMEAYEKYAFPKETLDMFVARYFFGDGE